MNHHHEPVIVHVFSRQPRCFRVTLADVLIVWADHRDNRERLASLFQSYPGLTALIAVTPPRLEVGLRDGTVMALRFAGRGGLSTASVDALARAIYFWWCMTTGQLGDPRAQSACARGTQAVVDVQCSREVPAGAEQVSSFRRDQAQ